MKLQELSSALKNAAKQIDTFYKKAENKSGLKYANEYVKKHHLEYIEEEIKAAFHEGFRFGLHQERSGKFKNR